MNRTVGAWPLAIWSAAWPVLQSMLHSVAGERKLLVQVRGVRGAWSPASMDEICTAIGRAVYNIALQREIPTMKHSNIQFRSVMPSTQ